MDAIINELKRISDTTFLPNRTFDSTKKLLVATSHSMQLGGAPLALLSLLQILGNQYNCLVITPSDGEVRQKFVDSGIGVFIAPANKYDCDEFKRVLENTDLYLCNTVVSGYYVSFAYGLATPTIWWIHEEHAFLNSYLNELYIKRCTSSNIIVAAVSKKAQRAVNEILHLPCDILSLGIEDHIGDYKKVNDSDKVRFFMPANLLYAKGHDVIAKAITMMPQEYMSRCEFVFAGGYDSVEDYPYQLMQILTESYSNIKYLGVIDRNEVFSLMALSDCILAPSRVDTLPTTIVEGMMMGKICLVSDATGISQYIDNGRNGYVFESLNPGALLQKLEYIIDNVKSIESVGINARNVYEDYFLAGKSQENINKLVDRINANIASNANKRLVMISGKKNMIAYVLQS